MYARCLRRSAATSLLRRNGIPSNFRRCLAAAESSPATSDSIPPPNVPRDGTITNIDTWDSVLAASVSNTDSQSSKPDDLVADISEEVPENEDIELEEGTEPEALGKQTRSNIRSPGIVLRAGNNSKHMPGILALVRQLERRFGRVREFRVLRDKDSPTEYLTTLFVTFHEYESMEKVKSALQGGKSGKIMLDPPPSWDRSRQLEGGVRLDEIQPFLHPLSAESPVVLGDSTLVERLEKETIDAEGEAARLGGEQDRSSQPLASTPVDGYECTIRIKPDLQACTPFLYDRTSRLSGTAEHRSRLARTFIQWAGFYPHYRFHDLGVEERTTVLKDSYQGEEKLEPVQLATRAMNSAILRFRYRLRELGDPNHGLTHQDSNLMMPEWELPAEVEKAEPTASSSPAKENATASTAEPVKSNLASTKWEKPKPLTPEEEESLQRLFSRSSLLRSQPDAKPTQSIAKNEKTGEKASSTAFSSHDSQASTRSPPLSPEPASQESQDSTTIDTSASALPVFTSPPADVKEQTSEMENNRSRRARRKAEQKKTGIKGKLLGWLKQ